jgi:hypothetical protein
MSRMMRAALKATVASGRQRVAGEVDHGRDDVDVAVDEPGHQGAAAQVNDRSGAGLKGALGHLADPSLRHPDACPGTGFAAAAVDQAGVGEQD